MSSRGGAEINFDHAADLSRCVSLSQPMCAQQRIFKAKREGQALAVRGSTNRDAVAVDTHVSRTVHQVVHASPIALLDTAQFADCDILSTNSGNEINCVAQGYFPASTDIGTRSYFVRKPQPSASGHPARDQSPTRRLARGLFHSDRGFGLVASAGVSTSPRPPTSAGAPISTGGAHG